MPGIIHHERIRNDRFFTTLDGLRGLAAVCIAIRHAPYIWGANGHPVGIFHASYLAVDFFFVLSGFVLAFAYQDRLSSNMKMRTFAALRIVRLYPTYLLSVLLTLPHIFWYSLKTKSNLSEILLSIILTFLMLPNPQINNLLFPYNIAVWSLFFENVSNVVFGTFAKILKIRLLAIYIVVSGIFLLLAVHQGWFGFGSSNGPMDAGPTWNTFFAGLARVMYSFFAGVLVYHLRIKSFLKINVSPTLLCISLLGILVAHPPEQLATLFDLSCVILIFPVIVLVGSYNNPTGFTSKIFIISGELSYGIYVLQLPIYNIIKLFFEKITFAGVNFSPSAVGVICIFSVVSISAVTFYAYDLPLRKKMSLIINMRRNASSTVRDPRTGGG